VYPRSLSLIVAGACALAALGALSACGGGGSSSGSSAPRTIRGNGFQFSAPGDWRVKRVGNEVTATPKPIASELESVTVFPLLRPYKPSIFPSVAKELDASAAQLATRLGGSVKERATTNVAGQRVRQYLLVYPQDKKEPKDTYSGRITFVLRGKTEYELLCRWAGSESEPDYCAQLERTFRPT
jgi:hypothetical protein